MAARPFATAAERNRDLQLTLRGIVEVFRSTTERWLTAYTFAQAWDQIVGDVFPGMRAGSPNLWATVCLLERRRYVRLLRPNVGPWSFTVTRLGYAQVARAEARRHARQLRADRRQLRAIPAQPATSESPPRPPRSARNGAETSSGNGPDVPRTGEAAD